jgi:hypothetical protein
MGEYAEEYTLKNFGVDISAPEGKTKWKWQCEKCGKKLSSKISHYYHTRDKHTKPQLEKMKGKS